jgi:hypothetical protein
MRPVTLPQLRAAFAMQEGPIPFEGGEHGHFRKAFARKQVFIAWRSVDGLCRRGLAKMTFRKQREKGRGQVIYLTGAFLTAAGRRLVKANPPMCVGCGCTDAQACPEGCSWVALGWCSACDEIPERSLGVIGGRSK